jgi:hypothetical protein
MDACIVTIYLCKKSYRGKILGDLGKQVHGMLAVTFYGSTEFIQNSCLSLTGGIFIA